MTSTTLLALLIIGAILAVTASTANHRKYGPSPIAVLERDFLFLQIIHAELLKQKVAMPVGPLLQPGTVLAENPTAKNVASGEWEIKYRFEVRPDFPPPAN